MGGGRAHQLAHVVDAYLAARPQAGWVLGFAHGLRVVVVVVVVVRLGVVDVLVVFLVLPLGVVVGFAGVVVCWGALLTGAISSSVSIRAWSPTEMAPASPRSQPWL